MDSVEWTSLDSELAGCLRRLFRSPYLLRSRNEKWYKGVIDLRKKIEAILLSFGAHLEINDSLGVIYVRPISEEIEEKISLRLARPHALSAFSSALMLHLRWHRLQFYLSPSGNEVPIIGAIELREFLQQFSQAKIDSHFEKQFRRGLDDLADLQVIIETAAGSEYYEITPICDLLLPADQIQDLRLRARQYFEHFSDTPAAITNFVVEGD